jgi:hypothetical protein
MHISKVFLRLFSGLSPLLLLVALSFGIGAKESLGQRLGRRILEGDRAVWEKALPFDFVILGFPKCGTTFLSDYLSNVEEVYMAPQEMCGFTSNTRIHDFFDGSHIRQINATAAANAVVRGFKCPVLMETESILTNAIPFLRDDTKFIVQLRHPVEWFQSYYNYMSRAYEGNLLPLEELPASCFNPYISRDGEPHIRNACSERTNFHHALSRLGKTPMTNENELELLQDNKMATIPIRGKVFVAEISQLSGEDPIITERFRIELADFLGLPEASFPHIGSRDTPDSVRQQSQSNVKYINICDEQYAQVRLELLKNGKRASEWIRNYFLESSEVFVSSKEHVLKRLEQWEKDPCQNKESGQVAK